MLGLEDGHAQLGHVVRGQLGTEAGVDHVDQGRQAGGVVQGREGDEQTHAGGVDGRGGDLQVARQLHLAFLAERIDLAAHAEDVGGDGVAHGVVRALGGGGVGDADTLDGARVVGRDGLVLDHRHAGDAVGAAHRAGAVADDAAQRRTLGHLFTQDAADPDAVAKGKHAGLHGHAEGHRDLDGIKAQVVHDRVRLGHVVEVVDGAVRAQRPDGLVLETRGLVGALDVGVDLRALDDAAGVAVVLGLAAAGDDGVVHGLAGDGLVALELAGGEVAGGQAAGLVDDVDEHVGAVLGQGLADRVVHQGLGKGAVGGLEGLGLGDLDLLVGRLDGDELDPLGAHDRAQAATAAGTHVVVRILDRDVGGKHLHLAGRADADHADLVVDALVELLDDGKVAQADHFALFLDGHAVLADLQAVPLGGVGRLALDDQGLDAQAGEHLRRRAAGVGLLDGAGERALGPAGKTAGVGRRGAGEQARGEDELVALAQRVAGWLDLGSDDGGGQAAAAQSHPGLGHVLDPGAQIRHVHAKNFISHAFAPEKRWGKPGLAGVRQPQKNLIH